MKEAFLLTIGLLCLGLMAPKLLLVHLLDAPSSEVEMAPAAASTPRTSWHLHPNPAPYAFRLEADPSVRTVEVYNSLGVLMRRFSARPGADYAVHDLPGGVYLVSLLDAEGRIMKTLRLNKDGIRP